MCVCVYIHDYIIIYIYIKHNYIYIKQAYRLPLVSVCGCVVRPLMW